VFSLALPAKPVISMLGQNLLLKWPTSVTGSLQSTTNLGSPVWTAVSTAPVVVNGQNTDQSHFGHTAVLPIEPVSRLVRTASKDGCVGIPACHSALPRLPASEIILIRVKTVIRSRATGKYLGTDGSWTSDLSQAAGFADVLAVISAVQVHKLAGVEMVIIMGDEPGKYDAVVALTDFRASRPGQSTAEGHRPP